MASLLKLSFYNNLRSVYHRFPRLSIPAWQKRNYASGGAADGRGLQGDGDGVAGAPRLRRLSLLPLGAFARTQNRRLPAASVGDGGMAGGRAAVAGDGSGAVDGRRLQAGGGGAADGRGLQGDENRVGDGCGALEAWQADGRGLQVMEV